MDKSPYPENVPVPYTEIVHDRAVMEIFRGCIRGCRFCQAGFIYRPVREKSPEVINKQAKALCENTNFPFHLLAQAIIGKFSRYYQK